MLTEAEKNDMVSKKIALALAKKKSQRLLRVIVLLTCVLSVSSLFADEILVNPDFETGALSPWAQARSFSGPEDWAHPVLQCCENAGDCHNFVDWK